LLPLILPIAFLVSFVSAANAPEVWFSPKSGPQGVPDYLDLFASCHCCPVKREQIQLVMLSEVELLPGKACCKGLLSKSVTDNICSKV
jgi:hypothetical protein